MDTRVSHRCAEYYGGDAILVMNPEGVLLR
jgi:hypothetical protein